MYAEALSRSNQCSLLDVSYYAYIEVKFCSNNPSSTPLTFTCGMELYYFNNHFTTIVQNYEHLAQISQPCNNLTRL